jgi:hypothetical protein
MASDLILSKYGNRTILTARARVYRFTGVQQAFPGLPATNHKRTAHSVIAMNVMVAVELLREAKLQESC